MTTSALPDILTDALKKEPIPRSTLDYLIARTKLRLHDFILRRLAAAEDGADGLDQAKVARRLGISRARVSQQLGVPGNWTVASVTKLAAAMGGEIEFTWKPFWVSPEEHAQPFQAPKPEQFEQLKPNEKDAA